LLVCLVSLACGDTRVPEGELPLGAIDTPARDAVIRPMPLLVGGWVVAPGGIREVRVYLGDELKGVTHLAVSRPDVMQAHPERSGGTDLLGWNLEIEVGPARGSQTILVRVVDERGRLADLASVPVVIAPW
ncbi:MAG: hypothetical protein H0X67_24510, partial [Acidobacteria bacterium]|nr:hypothetical protein [Acidobacteriota bacterium]